MQANAQSDQWHVSRWGVWGWSETILKGIGILAGLAAFFVSLAAPGFRFPSDSFHIAAMVLLVLATLLALVTVVFRFQQKEIISTIYSVPHALGHVGLLFALFRSVDVTGLAVAFGFFWAAGQLFKLQFLRITGYTEYGLTQARMIGQNIVFLVLYLLIAVMMLL